MNTDLKSFLQPGRLVEGVYHLSVPDDSETVYLKVREKEGRVYPDDMVRNLPDIDPAHPLHAEWMIRKSSLEKFSRYLEGKRVTLLDLGCGNGWMSNLLTRIPGCNVIALDMNLQELDQGARVFSGNPNLAFAYGDLFQEILPPHSFDVITLAGSVQYFPDLAALLKRLFHLLMDTGEVHIMDSPFYTEGSAARAKERTLAYYRKMGIPEAASRYHHHLLSALDPFQPELLYDSRALVQRIKRKLINRNLSPFPWIRLVNPPPE